MGLKVYLYLSLWLWNEKSIRTTKDIINWIENHIPLHKHELIINSTIEQSNGWGNLKLTQTLFSMSLNNHSTFTKCVLVVFIHLLVLWTWPVSAGTRSFLQPFRLFYMTLSGYLGLNVLQDLCWPRIHCRSVIKWLGQVALYNLGQQLVVLSRLEKSSRVPTPGSIWKCLPLSVVAHLCVWAINLPIVLVP